MKKLILLFLFVPFIANAQQTYSTTVPASEVQAHRDAFAAKYNWEGPTVPDGLGGTKPNPRGTTQDDFIDWIIRDIFRQVLESYEFGLVGDQAVDAKRIELQGRPKPTTPSR